MSTDQWIIDKPCDYCGVMMQRVGIRRQYCDDCRGHQRWRQIKHRYGITLPEYKKLFKEQGGVCAICKNPDAERQHLSVDHDRSCCPGERSCGRCIRGLLCNGCNTSLGRFKDDPDIIRRAADYVESARWLIAVQGGTNISSTSRELYLPEQTARDDKLGQSSSEIAA